MHAVKYRIGKGLRRGLFATLYFDFSVIYLIFGDKASDKNGL